MLEEEGIIISEKGNRALVKTKRTSACEGCGSINICESVSGGKEMIIEVENPINAQIGERVLIGLTENGLLGLSFLTYSVPLIAFVVGVLMGREMGDYLIPGFDKDLVSAGGGFLFLSLSFIFLRWWGRRFEKNKDHVPVILKVLSP